MFDITENAKLITVMHPADGSGAALTTEWISMENAKKATWILDVGSSAAGTMAVTLAVATTNTGTHAKSITSASADTTLGLDHYYTNSGDTYTKTTVSSSTFNIASTVGSTLYIVEVLAAEMGTVTDTSVYEAPYVRLVVSDPGAGGIQQISCLLTDLRYQQDAPPTAIA